MAASTLETGRSSAGSHNRDSGPKALQIEGCAPVARHLTDLSCPTRRLRAVEACSRHSPSAPARSQSSTGGAALSVQQRYRSSGRTVTSATSARCFRYSIDNGRRRQQKSSRGWPPTVRPGRRRGQQAKRSQRPRRARPARGRSLLKRGTKPAFVASLV
jgi:hypothetical protein